jgi:diketogulonate reductase-like aldo/keto reductase
MQRLRRYPLHGFWRRSRGSSQFGTRNPDHLNENLGATRVQLTPEELREIDTAFSKIRVHGGRMNEEQMRIVDQTI